MKRSSKQGVVLLAAGAALILSALSLLSYNRWDDRRSGKAAESELEELRAASVQEETRPNLPPESSEAHTGPGLKLPSGYSYMGYLSIPALKLELPVMSDWSYKKLKVAPCRQFGSVETDDLVIAGHNYRRHFGPIGRLRTGDGVRFTDMYGNVNDYRVVRTATLSPGQAGEVRGSGHALVLYTCTYSGRTRVVVFCDREKGGADIV